MKSFILLLSLFITSSAFAVGNEPAHLIHTPGSHTPGPGSAASFDISHDISALINGTKQIDRAHNAYLNDLRKIQEETRSRAQEILEQQAIVSSRLGVLTEQNRNFRLTEFQLPTVADLLQSTSASVVPDSTPGTFLTKDTLLLEVITNLYSALESIVPSNWQQSQAQELGLASVHQADLAYFEGRILDGHYFYHLAEGFLNLAVGIDPISGLGRDAFELFTGKNVITGEILTEFERTIAGVGVLSLGAGATVKGVVKIASRFPHIVNNLRTFRTALHESSKALVQLKKLKIKTPYKDAEQAFSREALRARVKVEQGDNLYRIGMKGQNNTGREAQFWSLEHPLTVSDYGYKYGVPKENITVPDFIEIGRIKSGSPFITAPAARVGSNKGGAIEVVVPEGAVEILGHSTL